MTDTTPPARDGALARLAEHLEATFNAHRMTLSRPDTREVFELTLDIVQGMVDSALAQGVIDQAQHGHLKQMLAGIKAVPEVLA